MVTPSSRPVTPFNHDLISTLRQAASGWNDAGINVVKEILLMDGQLAVQTNPGLKLIARSREAAPADSVGNFIKSVQIRPHFHPIVDLFAASVLGFEVLSRGTPPLAAPREMFAEAKRLGVTWELERACRIAALQDISQLPEAFRSLLYFINVSPDIFGDPRFVDKFTQERLREFGIDQKQIVIEITEEKTFEDSKHFGALIAHYTNQGFKIAMDDFGSGYSGLINLIATTPHYLKLDMAIVRDVHKHSYQQKLVKAITAFASSVNARLIAEGVECVEELEVLVRYGVRYAQGFLFGMPEKAPSFLPEEWKRNLREMVEKYDQAAVDLEEKVIGLVIRPMTIACCSMRCPDLDMIFQKQHHLDHVVILDRDAITGVITRQSFYAETGGAFGYQLSQKKPIEIICKRSPLIVDENMTVTTMAKLAMDRMVDDLYDPVLVVDNRGGFLGSVTMKQLMTKAIELEVRQRASIP
jgi:EAL domain-containing protein (putative c-di-GMP-specific phosphodiesterase class I)